MGTAAQKICVVCGKDVSGQPRWKDREGKYHCETCRSDYKIKTNLITGKQIVHYTCSHCKCALESPLEEAGQTFKCATCGNDVVTPGLADVIPLRATMEQQQRSRDEERHRRKAEERAASELEENQRREAAAKAAHEAAEEMMTCQVCGGHFVVRDVYNQDGKVVCRLCCEEQAAAEQEMLGCPRCGGVFLISLMHPSGFCKQCASRPSPRRMQHNPAPLKSLLPAPENNSSALRSLGILVLMLVGAFGAYTAYYALESESGQQTVVDKSNVPADMPQPPSAEPVVSSPPPAPTKMSASDLQALGAERMSDEIDADPIMSSIVDDLPEIGIELRHGELSLASSSLRLAWMSNQISYEEYRHANAFIYDHGGPPG
jgi:uncharacterized protein YbaR (Trm112 family)